MTIANGVFKAKIKDYSLIKTKKNDPNVRVLFRVQDAEARVHEIPWRAGFYGKQSTEITLETLMTLGLKSHEDVALMANGPSSGALNMNQVYEVKIETVPHYSDPTRTQTEIKYISVEGAQQKAIEDAKLDVSTAQRLLASVSLGAAFTNIKEKHKADQPAAGVSDDALAGIPF